MFAGNNEVFHFKQFSGRLAVPFHSNIPRASARGNLVGKFENLGFQ